MKQDRLKALDNNNYFNVPFGVRIEGSLLRFAVSIPEVEECKLKLYRSGSQKPIKILCLTKENRIGTVFFAIIDNSKLNADSYLYEADGQEFVDLCTPRLIGREKFGQEHTTLQGGFISSDFDWQKDSPLERDYSEMILYKLHVRGFTKQASSGVKHRGTYLGVAEKIEYLKELGINSILLMPCIEFNEILAMKKVNDAAYAGDRRFLNQVLAAEEQEEMAHHINYWGYAEENFYFAPKASYASNPENAPNEFKEMVRILHKEGIEVLMEMNFTNQIPISQRLEVLRYWILYYHIDGFRIDINQIPEELVATDPILARTKLLAVSWRRDFVKEDIHKKWLAEYNDGFLIEVRQFLKGDENQVGRFAERIKWMQEHAGIINYLADHNGFTLHDVYSYDRKHNEANGEQNRDGTDYNFSWNCGIEGKTRKKKINDLRLKMMKNAILTLFLSQGTPMLLSGDEFGNSQEGNNNAYCQDNIIGWVDWRAFKTNKGFFEFVKEIIAFRKQHKVFHNKNRLRTMDYLSLGCPDISFHGTKAWYPDFSSYSRTLGVLLFGHYVVEQNDESYFIIYNMHWEAHQFDLPGIGGIKEWKKIITTEQEIEQKIIKKEKFQLEEIYLIKEQKDLKEQETNLKEQKINSEEQKINLKEQKINSEEQKINSKENNIQTSLENEIETTSFLEKNRTYIAEPRSITVFVGIY